jgi:hypothetical protein
LKQYQQMGIKDQSQMVMPEFGAFAKFLVGELDNKSDF